MNRYVYTKHMKAMNFAALFTGAMLLTWAVAVAENQAFAVIGTSSGPLSFWELFFFGFSFGGDETMKRGSVSDDGSEIVSDPGTGILSPG